MATRSAGACWPTIRGRRRDLHTASDLATDGVKRPGKGRGGCLSHLALLPRAESWNAVSQSLGLCRLLLQGTPRGVFHARRELVREAQLQDDAIRQPQGIDGVVGPILKMKRILMKMCGVDSIRKCARESRLDK